MSTVPSASPDIAAMDALRAAQDRSFGSVGVPMVLALVPAEGSTLGVAGERVIAEGRMLAERLEQLRGELFPSQRDADMGCLISTVQALTVSSFTPAVEQ